MSLIYTYIFIKLFLNLWSIYAYYKKKKNKNVVFDTLRFLKIHCLNLSAYLFNATISLTFFLFVLYLRILFKVLKNEFGVPRNVFYCKI